MRVVVDCANGAAYKVAPETLWELGAEVIAIGVEPDGFNINREVGSTAPEALAAKVRELRADIGIALDGDADRVLIVDEKGQLVDGDQLMAVVARSWAEDGRLTQPGIVATIMSNLGLERYLGGLGLDLVRTAVGDRYVLEHMRQHGYNLGGEQSGHIILSDYTTTGDGLIAALQLLSWSSASTSRSARSATASSRCRRSSRTCATRRASRCRPKPVVNADRIRRAQRSAAAAGSSSGLGHRTGHPRHGRGRRPRPRQAVVDDIVEAVTQGGRVVPTQPRTSRASSLRAPAKRRPGIHRRAHRFLRWIPERRRFAACPE